jgi:hypothetical protein
MSPTSYRAAPPRTLIVAIGVLSVKPIEISGHELSIIAPVL